MTSFRISLTPSRRAAARFVGGVRRSIQRVLAEEKREAGASQSSVARAINVHRSVVSRELRGTQDMTLGRVAELAWALGREAVLTFPKVQVGAGQNIKNPSIPPSSESGRIGGGVDDFNRLAA